MVLSRLQSETDSGAPVRLVAERLKASGKLDGLIVRITFLGQPDDLEGPLLERLIGSDPMFGPPLMDALCHAQKRATGEAPANFASALKGAGASFARRVLLVEAIHQWSAIMASRQGINPKDIALQSLAMGHFGLWFGRFSKLSTPDSSCATLAMHGLGFGVMAATFGNSYGKAWNDANGSSDQLESIETERFGIHHGEAAAILGQAFNLHGEVAKCLMCHTLPITEIREYPLMMRIAEQCAAHIGFDGGFKHKLEDLPVTSMIRLGLKEADLSKIAEDVHGEAKLIFD